MIPNTRSLLRALTFTGALTALFTIGCVVPTEVGTQDSFLSSASGDVNAMAFHQPPDQDTLQVVLSTFPLACDNPSLGASGTEDDCPVGWTVQFALPAASQAPGVYSLSDPAHQLFAFQAMGSDGSGSCVGGGGGGIDGTVEVVSLDASTLTVRLSGFNGNADFPQADGDYDVPLCP